MTRYCATVGAWGAEILNTFIVLLRYRDVFPGQGFHPGEGAPAAGRAIGRCTSAKPLAGVATPGSGQGRPRCPFAVTTGGPVATWLEWPDREFTLPVQSDQEGLPARRPEPAERLDLPPARWVRSVRGDERVGCLVARPP